MQERHQRDERLQSGAEGKPAGDVREPRDLDLHRSGILRLGGLPLGPDREELDDPVIPHAELRRKVPGLVSLLQVGGLRRVQNEVRSRDGQVDEREVIAWLPLDPVRSPIRPGELPVDPAVPNPSRHWPLPPTALRPPSSEKTRIVPPVVSALLIRRRHGGIFCAKLAVGCFRR